MCDSKVKISIQCNESSRASLEAYSTPPPPPPPPAPSTQTPNIIIIIGLTKKNSQIS